MDNTMPVLFVGHGSPMNAMEDNQWSRGFKALADRIPRPAAILSISAHWYLGGTFVTDNPHPRTIHDFGGFPRELYEMQYQAPGEPALAARVADLLGVGRATTTSKWGLDHGTWTVLHHLYPKADIPVIQLSINSEVDAQSHLEFGELLASLRREGVLVMGSGNMVHNLGYALSQVYNGDFSTPGWAALFDRELAGALAAGDVDFLVEGLGTEEGALSHPTPDHYLPLLYAAGAARGAGRTSFPLEGFDLGSLSMRAVLWE